MMMFPGFSVLMALASLVAAVFMLIFVIIFTITQPWAILGWLPYIGLGLLARRKWRDYKIGIKKRNWCSHCHRRVYLRDGLWTHTRTDSRLCHAIVKDAATNTDPIRRASFTG